MDYCSSSDVQALVRDIEFSDDSSINQTQIEEIISQESANIDAKISKRYILPVPKSSAGYLVLKRLCVQFVLKRVAPLVAVSTDGDSGSNLRDIVSAFSPAKDLMAIVDGSIELIDVPQKKNGFQIQYDFPERIFSDSNRQW